MSNPNNDPTAFNCLLRACEMVLDAGEDGGGMEDIDWGMLRDAVNKAYGL